MVQKRKNAILKSDTAELLNYARAVYMRKHYKEGRATDDMVIRKALEEYVQRNDKHGK